MGSKKNQMKILAALKTRQDKAEPGTKKPGSMNKKKTGYVKVAPLNK
jgi:hypothetical protein